MIISEYENHNIRKLEDIRFFEERFLFLFIFNRAITDNSKLIYSGVHGLFIIDFVGIFFF